MQDAIPPLKGARGMFARLFKKTLKEKKLGKISPQDLENRLNAWLGHIRFGQSKRLEYNIFWVSSPARGKPA